VHTPHRGKTQARRVTPNQRQFAQFTIHQEIDLGGLAQTDGFSSARVFQNLKNTFRARLTRELEGMKRGYWLIHASGAARANARRPTRKPPSCYWSGTISLTAGQLKVLSVIAMLCQESASQNQLPSGVAATECSRPARSRIPALPAQARPMWRAAECQEWDW
jgi:hypothetical protein